MWRTHPGTGNLLHIFLRRCDFFSNKPPRGLEAGFSAAKQSIVSQLHIWTAAWCRWASAPFLPPALSNSPLLILKYRRIFFMEIYNNCLSVHHKEQLWVVKCCCLHILGLPVLLWDLAHLHAPAKLGQAVMGKRTCSSGETDKEVWEHSPLKRKLRQ